MHGSNETKILSEFINALRQSLSNGRKQLPAPLDQPADHSGVEDVRELLRCTRPGLPNPPRFFGVLTQCQMRTPIEHQPSRKPLKKKVGVEARHQTSSAGESCKVLQKINHQTAHHLSFKELIEPRISPTSQRNTTNRLHQQKRRTSSTGQRETDWFGFCTARDPLPLNKKPHVTTSVSKGNSVKRQSLPIDPCGCRACRQGEPEVLM